MNGMILYPTDDELDILNDIIVKEHYCSDKYKDMDMEDIFGLMFATVVIRSFQKYLIGIKPLKINETVLG